MRFPSARPSPVTYSLASRRASRPSRLRPLRWEPLENRHLLSTIVWANDGGVPGRNDPDFFDVAFGPNADVARADVRQAIQDWEQVIVNFNFDLPGAAPEYLNMFELSVQAKNLGSTLDQIDLGGRDTIYDRFGNDLTGRPPGGYPPVLQFGKPVLANINVDGMGGQDLLIAGASASTLQGTGADILIGGQTVDDHNLAALEFTL